MSTELAQAEKELFELTQKVAKLRAANPGNEVKNYSFKTMYGEIHLLDLFGKHDTLFLIHNMGQACRYCTLWADGLNGFIPHLESQFAFAMVSKDDPELQRQMANNRGWRFQMASHKESDYLKDQNIGTDYSNAPGMTCYKREGDKILKMNSVPFGPGDEFCSLWNVLSLAGISAEQFTPEYNYWQRPKKLEDGGE